MKEYRLERFFAEKRGILCRHFHCGFFGISRLQRGNHLAGLVAELPFAIELRRVAGADKAAIAGEQGEIIAKHIIELLQQIRGGTLEHIAGERQFGRDDGEALRLGETGHDLLCRFEAAAQRRQIARTPAPQAEAR